MRIEKDTSDTNIEEFIRTGVISGFIPEEGVYSLNIKVTDPVKANNFLLQFGTGKEDSKEFSEKCGFTIESINNFMAKDMSYVIDKLEECLDYLSNRDIQKGIKL